jgi:probable rRNA maturation factor
MTRALAPAIDIAVESELWNAATDADEILRQAVAAAAEAVAGPKLAGAELSIILTDDAAIRVLNRDWRDRDAATNVLSFPATDMPAPTGAPRLLGDIVIAYETTAREAAEEGKPFRNHLSHLTVHGFLHLLGHDHAGDDEAETMEDLERTILARLGVPDPYA